MPKFQTKVDSNGAEFRRNAAANRALVEQLRRTLGEVEAGGSRVSASPLPRATAAISRIGLVRFDAFSDAGGAQSFALALVDEDGDGVVLTSLHSRPTTRVYVKAIRRGVADAPLSAEETWARADWTVLAAPAWARA